MKQAVLVLISALVVMVAGVTNASASIVCFPTKQELLRVAPPGQKIYFTTVKQIHNDHVDLANPGPIGSKCWHMHYKLPVMNHLPRDNTTSYLTSVTCWYEPMGRYCPGPENLPRTF